MLEFILGFALLWGVLYLVATTYGWHKIWVHAFGPADMGPVQFEELTKGPRPNQALVCPKGVCLDKDRDIVSPVYALSALQLRDVLLNALQKEEGLERVDDGSDPLALRFVARTRRLQFPDTVRVRFYNLNDDSATIAIYSQSQIGRSDFGVNLARVRRWLKRLKEFEKTEET